MAPLLADALIPTVGSAALLAIALAGPALAQIPSTPTGMGYDMLCGSCIAPKEIGSRAIIARPGEPGERLVLSGRIVKGDGVSPAEGVTLFVFQADAAGRYSAENDASKYRLHGWVRSDANGYYELATIRPAPYPDGSAPAHIHVHLFGPGFPERFIPDFRFSGDTQLSEDERSFASLGRFSPILALQKDGAGVWRGTRDIRIESSQADLMKRVLQVGRMKELAPKEIASHLGCKLGPPEMIHAHRTEYALSGCDGLKNGRVNTGGKEWVAASLEPAVSLEMKLEETLPLLVDLPFHLRQETGHDARGHPSARGYSYMFGVPAGMIVLGVADEQDQGNRPAFERIRVITISNEPPAALATAKTIRQVRERK